MECKSLVASLVISASSSFCVTFSLPSPIDLESPPPCQCAGQPGVKTSKREGSLNSYTFSAFRCLRAGRCQRRCQRRCPPLLAIPPVQLRRTSPRAHARTRARPRLSEHALAIETLGSSTLALTMKHTFFGAVVIKMYRIRGLAFLEKY